VGFIPIGTANYKTEGPWEGGLALDYVQENTKLESRRENSSPREEESECEKSPVGLRVVRNTTPGWRKTFAIKGRGN